MIINSLVTIAYGIVYAITSPFRLLPDVALPAIFADSITTAGGYALALNNFLPVTTLLWLFGIFLVYEIAYFSMKLINWVIRKIPMIS